MDSVLEGKGIAKRLLKMGDKIYIYSKVEIFGPNSKSISIKGNVKRPGIYELYKNLNIRDIFFKAGGFKDSSFYSNILKSKANIYRNIGATKEKEIIPFNLYKAINGELEIDLKDGDIISIYSNISNNNDISVSGFVNSPRKILYAENLSVYDAILEAGGIKNYSRSNYH